MKILYAYENISGENYDIGKSIHNKKTVDALRNLGLDVVLPFQVGLSELPNIRSKRALYQKVKNYVPRVLEQLGRNLYDIYFDRFSCRKKIMKCVEDQRPDLIYERLSYFHSSASAVARKYQIPYLLEIHTPISVIPVKSWKKLAAKIYLKNAHLADEIIVVSSVLKKELQQNGISSKKIWVIPNAASEDLVDKVNSDKVSEIKQRYALENHKIIGFVGSMAPYHGIDFFIEGARELLKRANGIRFILVGPFQDKNVKERIVSLVEKFNLENDVTLLGSVPHSEIPNYLKVMDICVLPSKNNWYGSPIKLFEYAIMGRAIIASRFSPIVEVFKDNKNILLFDPGNLDDFVEKTERLIQDPVLRKKLGEEAFKEVIEHHTWDENAQKITQICRDLIHKKRIEGKKSDR